MDFGTFLTDLDGMMEKDLMEVDREALIKQEKDV